MTCRVSFSLLLLLLIGSCCCWTAATDIEPGQLVEITTESWTTDVPTTTILAPTTTTSTKTRISNPRRRISTVAPSATAVVRLETTTALPSEQTLSDQSRARILLGSEDDPNVLSVSPIVPPTSNSNDWTPIVRPTTRVASEASSVSAVQQSASTTTTLTTSSSSSLLIRPTPLLHPSRIPTILAAPARVGTQPTASQRTNTTTSRPILRPVSNSQSPPAIVRFNIEDAGLPPNPADSVPSPSGFPDDTIFFSPQFDDGNLTDNSAALTIPVRANPAPQASTSPAAAGPSSGKLAGPFGNRIMRNRTTTTTTTQPTPSQPTTLSSGLSAKVDEPATILPEETSEGNLTEVPTLSWSLNEDKATETPSELEMTTVVDLPAETLNAGTTEVAVPPTDPKTPAIVSIRTRPPRPTTTPQSIPTTQQPTTTARRRRPLTTEAPLTTTTTIATSENSTEVPLTTTSTTSLPIETTERESSSRTIQTTQANNEWITLFPAKTRPPSSTQNPPTTIQKVNTVETLPATTTEAVKIPTTTTHSSVPSSSTVGSHPSSPSVHEISHQTVHPLTSFTDPLTTSVRDPSTFVPSSSTTEFFLLGVSEWPSTEGSSFPSPGDKDSTTIIAVSVSIAVVLCIALLLLLFIVLRRRRARAVQGTCQPARMDAYSLDNVSQSNTWQRGKGRSTLRASKRSYLNQGFDDSVCLIDCKLLSECFRD